VALNEELDTGVHGQELRVLLDGSLLVGSNVVLVKIEGDVLGIRREQFLELGEAAATGVGGGEAFTVTLAVAAPLPPGLSPPAGKS
jgi:hypothetical protein